MKVGETDVYEQFHVLGGDRITAEIDSNTNLLHHMCLAYAVNEK